MKGWKKYKYRTLSELNASVHHEHTRMGEVLCGTKRGYYNVEKPTTRLRCLKILNKDNYKVLIELGT